VRQRGISRMRHHRMTASAHRIGRFALLAALFSPLSAAVQGQRIPFPSASVPKSGRPAAGTSQQSQASILTEEAERRKRESGGSAAVLQKQPTGCPSADRSVYKWLARRAAAASREGQEEEKCRRPLLPTGTAQGIAASPCRHPPQVISRILRSPASLDLGLLLPTCVGWGRGFCPRRPRLCPWNHGPATACVDICSLLSSSSSI
jgi:hypothetical protein